MGFDMVSESKKAWIVLIGCTVGSAIFEYGITKQTTPVPTAKTYVGGAAIGSFVGGIVTLGILALFT
jgi:hypothetical protein